MPELSIKLRVAEREYPMRVSAEEEERIRKAGREINERITRYKERFQIDDRQDLLAMVAVDICVDRLRQESQREETELLINDKLAAWDLIVAQALQETD
jgi:cell division protein ZapA